MPTRSQQSINTIVDRTRANMFLKEQSYGEALTLGVAEPPNLYLQSNLIFAASSDYTTLVQKNVYADSIGKYKFDVVPQDGYAVNNYWSQDYAQ